MKGKNKMKKLFRYARAWLISFSLPVRLAFFPDMLIHHGIIRRVPESKNYMYCLRYNKGNMKMIIM